MFKLLSYFWDNFREYIVLVILVIIGFILLFLNLWIGFNTVLSGLAGGFIPIMFIPIGIMAAINAKKKESSS